VIDDATLAAIGATIVGFGIVAFVYRVQRELQVQEALQRKFRRTRRRRAVR